MDAKLVERYGALLERLKASESLAIAFSGGVDSTFLAHAAFEALGDRSLAVTVDSEAYPPGSIDETRALASHIGIRLVEIRASVFDIPEFVENQPMRCYHCKKALFTMMRAAADAEDMKVLADGSNADDVSDFRPGMKALEELGVASPLRDLDFTKNDIRALSREFGLPTWNHQSFACLASRVPYGDHVTPEIFERTWKAEAFLHKLGLVRYRVRNHGTLARIETDENGIQMLVDADVRARIVERFSELGYSYTSLDLEGYRTGSMNEPILGTAAAELPDETK